MLLRLSAMLVALVAVGIGLLASGTLTKLGVFKYFDDQLDMNGNHRLRGMAPAFHAHTPWGFHMEDIPDGQLAGQVFVVTGANVGLGYWTARHLVAKGGHVVLACRSEKKCANAVDSIKATFTSVSNAGSAEYILLDLGSSASIHSFAQSFKTKHDKLHSLILNAGIMRNPFSLTADGIERQIGVNHFGHAYLTHLLQDLLVQTASASQPATISVVSSSAHFRPYPEGVRLSMSQLNDESVYNEADAYGQSKLANVLFAQELSERLKDKHVLVNTAHPGGVNTELSRHIKDAIMKKLPSPLGRIAVDYVLSPVLASAFWHPREGALTQVYTAVGPQLLAQRITGKYYHPIARETKPHSIHAFNQTLQKGLWELTTQVIKDFEQKQEA